MPDEFQRCRSDLSPVLTRGCAPSAETPQVCRFPFNSFPSGNFGHKSTILCKARLNSRLSWFRKTSFSGKGLPKSLPVGSEQEGRSPRLRVQTPLVFCRSLNCNQQLLVNARS